MTIRLTKKCCKINEKQEFSILFAKEKGCCHTPSKGVCRKCINCWQKAKQADEFLQ